MRFSAFDNECMALALQLARKGWYTAHPNPRVGCVIARDGEIVGRGYHHRAGQPHAEVNALRDAGNRARGGIAYVTLEPCNHQGRTGPCAQALIEAGVREVVFAMADPHQAAAGGLETLKSAGINVRGPLMEAQARALNPGFVSRCETGLPRVTVKLAMSLDGRTAMASGESQWITGSSARRDVQLLRSQSGAVITGVGTVLDDDPAMTVREEMLSLDNAWEIASRQPLRVIVDSALRTPPSAKMLALEGPVLIATAKDLQAGSGLPDSVSVVTLAGSSGQVDLKALLEHLARQECNDVLVEAGPTLCGAFMAAGLVDQLVIYVAGKLMGSRAQPLMSLDIDAMADAVPLSIEDIRAVGADWRITARREK